MYLFFICSLTLIQIAQSVSVNCPCGWLLKEQDTIYTHRLYEDFAQYPDIDSLLNSREAARFNRDWMIYDY
ncbi:uncharacterized protein Z520_01292 [Fonsecaea multimorphosa CBS 102226]|uniref:Uncharacterized protein n=1 Tax=Fonsecaea multimorphosa CBS 102226 TaxID=1442371 RepID=A0A0D2J0E4_9EURO|nr:uncharacterized protein Z520_01292 [Fonsecaea multimorphosa CBS 102226]KIY02827.1 hypothetical protein Z520_01292 [Fonsecaea multimorphosa CBS 102226]